MTDREATVLHAKVAEHLAALSLLCDTAKVRAAQKELRDIVQHSVIAEKLSDVEIALMFLREFTEFSMFIAEENYKANNANGSVFTQTPSKECN